MIKLRPAVCGGVLLLASYLMAQKMPSPSQPSSDRVAKAFAKLPLAFEPNRGQADPAVQFLAHSPSADVYLVGPDAVLSRTHMKAGEHGGATVEGRSVVRMHLVGAAAQPTATPESSLPGRVNYLSGNDRSRWATNVPTYSGVRLASVYPGVDLRYYGHAGALEYDFIVAPRHDASAIRFTFAGAKPTVETNGNLALKAEHGDSFRFDQPVAYQMIDGKRATVPAQFKVAENDEVSFRLGAYDHSRELVIDPTLIFLGTLGTGAYPAHTNLSQIAVNAAGEMYFIGTTDDANFPVTAGAYQTVCGPTKGVNGQVEYDGGYCPSGGNGEQAAFIAKLSADGTQLVYGTYLSGQSGTEQGISITVDSAGVAYLLGTTASDDFPVTSDAFQKNCYAYYGVFGGPNIVKCDGNYNGGGTEYTLGNQDAFISKLSADGSKLLYSTFLGGTAPVYPNTIALDSTGNIYVSGQVQDFDLGDLTGCQSCGPNSQGQLQFTGITSSGYMTGSAAINSYGNATSINVTGFLSKFSNDGHTLLYGTFFGDNISGVDVVPRTMAVGTNGVAFIGGETGATNYPTTPGAIKSSCVQAGSGYGGISCNTVDGFVAAIDTTKSGAASLVYSTRLGGTTAAQGSNSDEQEVLGLTADSSNDAFVTGYTYDSTFAVGAGGYQSTCPNNTGNIAPTADGYIDRCDSAFLLKIDPTGTKILAGTFLGGPDLRSAESVGYVVRLDSKGQVYLYGLSDDGGGDFPQVNPLQPYKSGNQLFISTFTPDLSKLLFSTRFGNPSYTDHSVNVAGGMALDANDNVYFAGDTTDVTFAATSGTYSTPGATGDHHAFFAKVSKVLQPTSTTVTVTPETLASGANMTLNAVVTGLYQSTPAATGTVTFTALATGGTTPVMLGTGTLDSTGAATATVQAPAAGTYAVTASYGADEVYDVSASSSATLTVNAPVTPTITLTPSATSGKPNTQFTFTAKLTSSAGTPTGTVYFLNGSTMLGSGILSSGAATYSTILAPGSHSITAQYGGDTTFATVTSSAQTVTVAAVTLSYSYSPNPVIIKQGSTGTVIMTVTPDGAYTGSVSLGCNGMSANITCSFSPATLSFSNSSTAMTSTITITTQPEYLSQNGQPAAWRDGSSVLALLVLPLGYLARRKKLWAGSLMLFVLASAAMVGLSGCSGGGSGSGQQSNPKATPVGTTSLSITVNGTDNGTPLTVTVQ